MKLDKYIKTACLLFPFWLVSCDTNTGNDKDAEMNRFVSELMSKMTLEEKIGQSTLISSWWAGCLAHPRADIGIF